MRCSFHHWWWRSLKHWKLTPHLVLMDCLPYYWNVAPIHGLFSWLWYSLSPSDPISAARVIKKGDKLNPDNYRPISIISIASKVCKRIFILKEITKFLLTNEIISSNQHGFLSGLSVITNLLQWVNDYTRAVDVDIPVDVVYFDYTRAFDSVPYCRLL